MFSFPLPIDSVEGYYGIFILSNHSITKIWFSWLPGMLLTSLATVQFACGSFKALQLVQQDSNWLIQELAPPFIKKNSKVRCNLKLVVCQVNSIVVLITIFITTTITKPLAVVLSLLGLCQSVCLSVSLLVCLWRGFLPPTYSMSVLNTFTTGIEVKHSSFCRLYQNSEIHCTVLSFRLVLLMRREWKHDSLVDRFDRLLNSFK